MKKITSEIHLNLTLRSHFEVAAPALTSVHFVCASLVSVHVNEASLTVSVCHTHKTSCSFSHNKRYVCRICLIKSYKWIILQLAQLTSQSFFWRLEKDVLLYPFPLYLAGNKRWLYAIDLEIDGFSRTSLHLLKQTRQTRAFTKTVPTLPVLR